MKKIWTLPALLFIGVTVFAQPKNWHQLDLKADSIFGISSSKAYNELLQHKKAQTVIVAVIDSGVDTTHEDLTSVLWINRKEAKRPMNGRDDDHNSHVDDIYGWSFLGTPEKNIQYDNLEITRLVRDMQQRGDTTGEYIVLKKQLDEKLAAASENLKNIEGFQKLMLAVLSSLGTNEPTMDQLKAYQPKNSGETYIVKVLTNNVKSGKTITDFINTQILPGIKHYKTQVSYQLNLAYDERRGMRVLAGINDVHGPDPDHGTHVAGIIAADRNNSKGIEGIAGNAKIMVIRAVPDGDERDEDIARAIMYATANGARVINMSFGKPYSPGKKLVDDAVRFAMAQDVLLIHAAGNDGKDTDKGGNYPTRMYMDSTQAGAWIEVGASGWKNDESLAAGFSNYGKTTVDVFAPGVNIYSTTPGSKYALHDGTSMAAPVVAGVAALIRGYYPKLTAVQVKEIVMNSVTKADVLRDKCKTGGVVNAYEALKLAATY